MAQPRQILLLGPPASGKGTQAKRLARSLSLAHCSTGSVLRLEEKRATPLGEQIHAYLKNGSFVPDDLILAIVRQWLQSVDTEFVLDGFPRTLPQGQALERFLEDAERPLPIAVCLEVSEPVLRERISGRVGCDPCGNVWSRNLMPDVCPDCGAPVRERPDDSVELFEARLAEYRKKTLPLLPHYEDKNRLRRVCGEGHPDAVFQRLLEALSHE